MYVERIPVEFVELDRDIDTDFHPGRYLTACLADKPVPEPRIVGGPDRATRLGYGYRALVFFYQFDETMAVGSCPDLVQFTYHPIGVRQDFPYAETDYRIQLMESQCILNIHHRTKYSGMKNSLTLSRRHTIPRARHTMVQRMTHRPVTTGSDARQGHKASHGQNHRRETETE